MNLRSTQRLVRRHAHALLTTLFAAAAACASKAVFAEVIDVAPTGFTAAFRLDVKAPPARVFEAFGHIERWWNPEHSYSGVASNLSMPLEAGACFCERWDGGSVQHGVVVMVLKDKLVRVDAALGPLQGLAVNGMLTLGVKVVENHSVLEASYRVIGAPQSALDKHAAGVDRVIGEQMRRLVNLVENGRP